MKKLGLFLLLILVPLMSIAAQDNLYTAISQDDMVLILSDMGFPAEITENNGNKFISLKISGFNVRIIFYSEQKENQYQTLMFISYYTVEDMPFREKVDLANSWNEEKLFGKAFVDSDEDFGIDMSVSLEGGITREALEARVILYRTVINGFTKYIDF